MLNYSVRINGIDSFALMKIDVLSGLDELKICKAYKYNGKTLTDFPNDVKILEKCEPVYETFKGWPKITQQEWQNFEKLPKEVHNYVLRIEELTKTPISLVSFGPERSDTFIKKKIVL